MVLTNGFLHWRLNLDFMLRIFKDESDNGIVMETIVPTKEIKEGINEFLDNGVLRVRIVWKVNLQLFQSTYHPYDDIYR